MGGIGANLTDDSGDLCNVQNSFLEFQSSHLSYLVSFTYHCDILVSL